MKTSTRIKIFLRQNGSASGSQLAAHLGLGDRAVRKQLKTMLQNGQVTKSGRPPKVFYALNQKSAEKQLSDNINIDESTKNLINDNFLYITPQGVIQRGLEGFIYWTDQRKYDPAKTAERYRLVQDENGRHKRGGLVDLMYKLRMTFDDVALDEAFAIDYHQLDLFGPTKLAQLVSAAKLSQSRELAREIAQLIHPAVKQLIETHDIDAIGYISPTIKRQRQLMEQLLQESSLGIQILPIKKVRTPLSVPQAILIKLEDRIANARSTIAVEGGSSYVNILLFDDHLDSGATLNETARQIRNKNICQGKVVAVAITGNPQIY